MQDPGNPALIGVHASGIKVTVVSDRGPDIFVSLQIRSLFQCHGLEWGGAVVYYCCEGEKMSNGAARAAGVVGIDDAHEAVGAPIDD